MNIVFDIGNVLVRWNPHLAFAHHLKSPEEAQAFLDRCDFAALNRRCDGGESFADMIAAVADAKDRALVAAYPERFALTIAEPIEGTWALMERLRGGGRAIHAITNWSAELWPVGIATHPRLATSFGVTIVSGQERMQKPDPAIFRLLCRRAGVRAAYCLFIDDSPANVAGARDIGMGAVLFTTPEALETDLVQRGLL